jgi:hypothetical protein
VCSSDLSWGGKNGRHIRALFQALGDSLDGFEQRYPGNAFVSGCRPLFAVHAR